jgi:hypothetical protein
MDEDQSSVIQNVLWHFYHTPTFRNLIAKGLHDGCRIALVLFDLIKDIVSILRNRNIDHSVTSLRQNEAYAWLDTMMEMQSQHEIVD